MQVVKDDIAQLVESQQELGASFENAVNRKLLGAGDASRNEVQSAAADVRNNAAVFALALKQHPLATDNIEKVQSDRFLLYCDFFCESLLSLSYVQGTKFCHPCQTVRSGGKASGFWIF